MIENIIEGIKLIGGIAGLATATFPVLDRFVRDRPQVSILARPIYGSGQRFLFFVVRNISEENRDVQCRVKVQWRSMRHEHIPCSPVYLYRSVRTMEAQRDNKAHRPT